MLRLQDADQVLHTVSGGVVEAAARLCLAAAAWNSVATVQACVLAAMEDHTLGDLLDRFGLEWLAAAVASSCCGVVMQVIVWMPG